MMKGLFIATCAFLSTPALSATIICSNVKAGADKMICDSQELKAEDEKISIVFANAMKNTRDPAGLGKKFHSAIQERAKCSTERCLRDWFTTQTQMISNFSFQERQDISRETAEARKREMEKNKPGELDEIVGSQAAKKGMSAGMVRNYCDATYYVLASASAFIDGIYDKNDMRQKFDDGAKRLNLNKAQKDFLVKSLMNDPARRSDLVRTNYIYFMDACVVSPSSFIVNYDALSNR